VRGGGVRDRFRPHPVRRPHDVRPQPVTEALLASNPHHASKDDQLPTIPGGVPAPGAWPSGCHFHPRCGYATSSCRDRGIPLERSRAGRETRCIHSDRLVAAGGT
jgi:peptide/nickel transport system permease protein